MKDINWVITSPATPKQLFIAQDRRNPQLSTETQELQARKVGNVIADGAQGCNKASVARDSQGDGSLRFGTPVEPDRILRVVVSPDRVWKFV
jgi:hypothetical protein